MCSFERRSQSDLLYVEASIVSGSSVMATSNRDWMSLRTSSLSSLEMNEIASPFVPNRPARLSTNLVSACIIADRRENVPDSMEVGISISRSIVVEDDVESLDI